MQDSETSNSGVRFVLDGDGAAFHDLAALESWLAPRCRPDQSRLLDAAALSGGDLSDLVDGLHAALNVIEAVRALADRDAEACLDQLKTVHPRTVTQDQGWREILAQASDWEPNAIAYVRILLDAYLTYLRARLRRIQQLPQRQQASARPWNEVSLDMRQRAGNEMERRQLERAVARLREGFACLPYDQAVVLPVMAGSVVHLILGHHDFELVVRRDSVTELVDVQKEEGRNTFRHRYLMPPGIYRLGRDQGSDLVIDSEYRDVSRCHMIINTSNKRCVEFTDLSSQGTFVETKWLQRANAVSIASVT